MFMWKKKVYIFTWGNDEESAAQLKEQEEPGSSMVDKSPQFIYIIKLSSENWTLLLSSALSPYSYFFITSFNLVRQHIDDKCGKKINIYYST